jgi:hypothetical protein
VYLLVFLSLLHLQQIAKLMIQVLVASMLVTVLKDLLMEKEKPEVKTPMKVNLNKATSMAEVVIHGLSVQNMRVTGLMTK